MHDHIEIVSGNQTMGSDPCFNNGLNQKNQTEGCGFWPWIALVESQIIGLSNNLQIVLKDMTADCLYHSD